MTEILTKGPEAFDAMLWSYYWFWLARRVTEGLGVFLILILVAAIVWIGFVLIRKMMEAGQ